MLLRCSSAWKVSPYRCRAKRCLSSPQFSPALIINSTFFAVVVTAATAAFTGQLIGYMIGQQFGYRLLLKYGGYFHITEGRIKLGEYLFLRYGIAIVIVARFVPVLRSFIGILAGANRMCLRRLSNSPTLSVR